MRPPRSVRWAVMSYRALLGLLPRRIRALHREEMESLFEHLVLEAHLGSGVRGVLTVWLRSMLDVFGSRDVERVSAGWRPALLALRSLDALMQDSRLSLRKLVSKPVSAVMAVGSLAVGMAVTVGIFTFVDTILWKDWSFRDAERVVQVFERRDQYLLPSWPTFRAVEENVELFDGVVASQLDLFALGGTDGGARTVAGERVSEDYFRVLGLAPERGRYPASSGIADGLPVVISQFLWESQFGSAPEIIGRGIELNGHSATIVAVAPAVFDGTKWGVSAELWVPIDAWARADGWTGWEDDRGLTMTVMARMKEGVDVGAVNAALASLAGALRQERPAVYEGMRLEATDRLRGDMGPEIGVAADFIALLAIFGGVLVLLVGCGNVASLQLARGVLRTREVAVRYALGASRSRVIRQLLTESLVLAGVATVAGLVLSAWGSEALVGLLPTFDFRVNFQTRPGPRSMALAGGLALLAVVVSGLVPAMQLSRSDLGDPMKSDGRTGLSRGRSRLLGVVVAGMVAVSVLALFLAGVFGRALDRSRATEPGFATRDRVMAVVPLRLAGYGWRDATAVFEDLERRIAGLPGAVSVGFATGIPLGEAWATAQVWSADRAYPAADAGIRSFRSSVSDDYFRAMGTRIVRGRAFGPGDGPDGPWVAVVNEELADRLWPGQDPIGRHIRFGLGEEAEPVEVVGVAETGLYYMAGESPEPAVYASFRQWPQAQAMVVLESRGDPLQLVPRLREELLATDPDVPLQRVRTAEAHFREALWLHRLGASIGGVVSLLSMLMAAAGLYGVMSFTLGARRRELGIRRALGAGSPAVVALAVRGAVRLTVLGLAAGALLSALAGQVLRTSLAGVQPWDPVVLGVTTILVLGVGAVSGLIPGVAASRTDPASVLNAEN